MADFAPVHPLGDKTGRENAGISLKIMPVFMMAQLFSMKNKADSLAKKLKIGMDLGVAAHAKDFTALPLAPGQWMIVSHETSAPTLADLEKRIGKLGYVSQQSDARICIRVSGPKARELMSRGCRLDLHQSVAGKGFCAQTPMAQIGVLLHQVDDAPTYDLYVYSGFARSFWHWLETTAAQFA